MRHPRMTIGIVGVAAVAGVSGIVAATAGGSTAVASNSKASVKVTAPTGTTPAPPTSSTPVASSVTATTATVHTINTSVDGKTESVLVDSSGLPLYFYKPDTAAASFVNSGLAALWPPLVAANPTAAGVTGTVSAVKDVHDGQVVYNGHFLYTFVGDSAGHVSGQGVQNFFVATPGLSAIGAASSASTTRTPAPSRTGPYGY
jgi:predicted lipoprotein with Yx(FWY)xxD motif